MTKSNQNKSLLLDVSILRPVLIVLLVFYHAFAIYSGAWKPISGFPEVKFYWWLDKLSYASMLETFVFMSGYVFGYQVRTKGDVKLEAKNLFLSKFKRLIIPSMIFSLLYILFFQGTTQSFISISYDIVNGVAHMWFLPMLFWCFVGVWVIEKMKLTPKLVLALLILCSIFWIVPLPFQMGETMYYLLFFYTGYLIQRVNVNMKLCYTPRFILIIFISFIVLFPSLTLFREHAEDIVGGAFSGDLIVKYVSYFLSNIAKLVYSTLGLVLLFIVVGNAIEKHPHNLPQWIIEVGEYCMGVYLFQQFVLKGLYNYTGLSTVLGPYSLPWVGFVVTLFFSLALSYVLRKTNVGRFLIG